MNTVRFKTEGTCSREILVTLDGDVVQQVQFFGGCGGNLQAVSILVRGRRVEEVIAMLQGIQCQNGTSCPDQLAKALRKACG